MESKIDMVLPVEVQLGSPRKNCLHFGICKVEFYLAPKGSCSCICPALLSRGMDGTVSLVFYRQRMAPKVWEKYFASGVFRVDDAFVFRKEIISQIGIDALAVFPGEYLLSEKNGRIRLVLSTAQLEQVEKVEPTLSAVL